MRCPVYELFNLFLDLPRIVQYFNYFKASYLTLNLLCFVPSKLEPVKQLHILSEITVFRTILSLYL